MCGNRSPVMLVATASGATPTVPVFPVAYMIDLFIAFLKQKITFLVTPT
jgi:hypothetical protein